VDSGIIDNLGNVSPRDPFKQQRDLNRNGVLETGDDTNQNGSWNRASRMRGIFH
jgi:hypothetical protein